MPEITTCPTEIVLELKRVLRRSGSPHLLCPFTSFPSPNILNDTEINPRFLICLRLISQGRRECQEVMDFGEPDVLSLKLGGLECLKLDFFKAMWRFLEEYGLWDRFIKDHFPDCERQSGGVLCIT